MTDVKSAAAALRLLLRQEKLISNNVLLLPADLVTAALERKQKEPRNAISITFGDKENTG